MLTQVMCYASQKKKKKSVMQFFLVRTWYLGSAQCMGMTQRPNLSALVNREPEPNNRLCTMPTQKLAIYQEWILLGTVVPWGKSPTENQSAVEESFKMVTSILKNWFPSGQESILEGSHPPEKLPNYHDYPTKGSL